MDEWEEGHRYIVKIGGTVFRPQSRDEHSPEEWADAAHGRFVDGLKESPHIFEMREDGSRNARFWWNYKEDAILDGPTYSMRVHIPWRHQHYQSGAHRIEDFRVVLRGSVFLAWAPIENRPVSPYIGHEFRVLSRRAFEQGDIIAHHGPSPIHPTVYLILKSEEEGERKYFRATARHHGIEVEAVNFADPEEAVTALCDRLWRIMGSFYIAMSSRLYLLEGFIDMSNGFASLAEDVDRLIETSAWRIRRRVGHVRTAKQLLSELHQLVVSQHTHLVDHRRNRGRMREAVGESEMAIPLLEYFEQHVDASEYETPQSFLEVLQHFHGQVESYHSVTVALLAATIGALIGAGATAVLTGGP